jgi:hypothetical protein
MHGQTPNSEALLDRALIQMEIAHELSNDEAADLVVATEAVPTIGRERRVDRVVVARQFLLVLGVASGPSPIAETPGRSCPARS